MVGDSRPEVTHMSQLPFTMVILIEHLGCSHKHLILGAKCPGYSYKTPYFRPKCPNKANSPSYDWYQGPFIILRDCHRNIAMSKEL